MPITCICFNAAGRTELKYLYKLKYQNGGDGLERTKAEQEAATKR
jgi:hypothetical protein